MIKYIIFDVADVLCTGIDHTSRALVQKYNLDTSERALPLLTPLATEYFHGNVSEDEYLDEVVQLYPQMGRREDLKRYIREHFQEVEGTRDIVLRLRKLGYRLAILSIHGKEWIEYCDEKFHFHQLFDVIAYSYEDRVSKPNKTSFELVLARLSAKPEECLFIDDTLANIKAAQELGIMSIQFLTARELDKQLASLLPNYTKAPSRPSQFSRDMS